MDFTNINFIAVGASAVAAFVFGAVYYTLLGKAWMDAVGTTEEELKGSRTAVPFVTSFVSLLVSGTVLSAHLASLSDGVPSLASTATAAAILWAGFVLTTTATNNAFQGNKFKLTILDTAHWLVVLMIQGLVIRAF